MLWIGKAGGKKGFNPIPRKNTAGQAFTKKYGKNAKQHKGKDKKLLALYYGAKAILIH
jgi:hypothetical protein